MITDARTHACTKTEFLLQLTAGGDIKTKTKETGKTGTSFGLDSTEFVE